MLGGMFSTDHRTQWEQLARQDPYFSVLSDAEYRGETLESDALESFFASGRRHVERILLLADVENRRFDSVLDFGCGVGRVTLALAGLSRAVVGVDVSRTMLRLAADHATQSGVANVVWQPVSDFVEGAENFDFVHSFLVFQHIPRAEGMALLRKIAARVRTKGIIAVHFPYWRPGGLIRNLLRRARAEVPGVNLIANLVQGKTARSPYMQMNAYDLNDVVRELSNLEFSSLRLIEERQGDIHGVIVIGRREAAAT